jgi:hypothetical protein
MMARKFLLLLAILGLTAACEKQEEPQAAPTAETTAQAAPTPTPAAAVAQIDLETLPTEEQFEDEAEKEITSDNLEQKLDELEKEISAE